MPRVSYLLLAGAVCLVNGCGQQPPAPTAPPGAVAATADPDAKHRAIFREMVAEERRATSDAAAGKGIEGDLRERYWADLARRHGLTDAQLIAISVEAYQKGWKY